MESHDPMTTSLVTVVMDRAGEPWWVTLADNPVALGTGPAGEVEGQCFTGSASEVHKISVSLGLLFFFTKFQLSDLSLYINFYERKKQKVCVKHTKHTLLLPNLQQSDGPRSVRK